MDLEYLENFVDGYVACALWSSTDQDGNPLDDRFGPEDLSPETMTQFREDCEDFATANEHLLQSLDPEQSGHDFWLTRNRHGAGFWDRGLGEVGDKLSEAAKVYGGVDLYVGDDGKIYA